MSFDPEKVQRYEDSYGGTVPSDQVEYVLYSDYAQLLSLLHDVSSEADPAGTLRELRLAQGTVKAQEKMVDALIVKIKAIKGAVNDEKPHDALRPLLDELLKGAYGVLEMKGEGQ